MRKTPIQVKNRHSQILKRLDESLKWLKTYSNQPHNQQVLTYLEPLPQRQNIKQARKLDYYKGWSAKLIPDYFDKPAILSQVLRDLKQKGRWTSECEWRMDWGAQYKIDLIRRNGRKIYRATVGDKVKNPSDSYYTLEFTFAKPAATVRFLTAINEFLPLMIESLL